VLVLILQLRLNLTYLNTLAVEFAIISLDLLKNFSDCERPKDKQLFYRFLPTYLPTYPPSIECNELQYASAAPSHNLKAPPCARTNHNFFREARSCVACRIQCATRFHVGAKNPNTFRSTPYFAAGLTDVAEKKEDRMRAREAK
jgi:hypothetical protein